jgi:predicted metal-dependent enzyme (double-stranded beta helix superfamily)
VADTQGTSAAKGEGTTTTGDDLVAACVDAMAESDPRGAVRAILTRSVADRRLAEALEGPSAGLNVLHHSAELTILNVVWPPLMSLFPHDHRMWAAIGIYSGREDNTFFRRSGGSLVRSGGKELVDGSVLLLGDEVIHAVHNPARSSYTGAVHVYGGDFFGTPRSQWDAETLQEHPYDVEASRRAFDRAEQAFQTGGARPDAR